MTSNIVLLVCDIQERFANVIHGWDHLLDSSTFILEIAKLLNLETVVTEQYPKGLGHTASELLPVLLERTSVSTIEKMDFSMVHSPGVQTKLKSAHAVVLIGLEAHVCVLQTCQDLLKMYPQMQVLLPVDAISSSRRFERSTAMRRMAAMPNVKLTTCESLAFELLGSASHPHFKAVSALVKSRSARLYHGAGNAQAQLPAHGAGQVRAIDGSQVTADGRAAESTTPAGTATKRIEPVLCTFD